MYEPDHLKKVRLASMVLALSSYSFISGSETVTPMKSFSHTTYSVPSLCSHIYLIIYIYIYALQLTKI